MTSSMTSPPTSPPTGPALAEALKNRLFASISAQIDGIAWVPEDLARRLNGVDLSEWVGAKDPAKGSTGESVAAAPPPAASPADLAKAINGHYDHVFFDTNGILAQTFDATGFRNIGYWDETTTTLDQASRLLLEKLLAFIPKKTGRILDVACGMGATTARLLQDYPAENVWAINISEKQIESTKARAPGANALVMNAVEMTFEDDFFDNMLCVEAAFHFETRRKFLEDARRVLKPGGRLVMSDVLMTSAARLEQFPLFPSGANHLADAAEYEALLVDVGYREVIVQDVTQQVWRAHFLHVAQQLHARYFDGALDLARLTEVLWLYYVMDAITGPCLFVSARA